LHAARDPLDAIAELERRFDGPIPEPVRLLARLGSEAAVQLLQAEGQAAFFKAMVTGQIRAIRRRRAEGSEYPAMAGDLALYRTQLRHWRGLARELRERVSIECSPLSVISAFAGTTDKGDYSRGAGPIQNDAERPPSTVRMWPLT
jgi:hypothetical protein